jgi:hypothetical protein
MYRDEHGQNFMRTTRRVNAKGEKEFPQQHWDGRQWKPGKPKGPKILYRLPEFLAAPPDVPVWVCAGEKDAESVAALGFVATTNSEGETRGKWTVGLNTRFEGRKTVYILEDNDETGRGHVSEVANNQPSWIRLLAESPPIRANPVTEKGFMILDLWKLVIVVSCPPCWLAVLVNTLPTLPASAPLIHNPLVWSRKLRICAHMLPKRVGYRR